MRSCEHCFVHSLIRRCTLFVRPIFNLTLPDVLPVRLDTNALYSCAARIASPILRIFGKLPSGNSEDPISAGGGADLLESIGVTQNM